jgi:hypothetical protein
MKWLLVTFAALCLLASAPIVEAQGKKSTDTKNRWITVYNETSKDISLIHAERTGRNNEILLGNDLIPDGILSAGTNMRVNFDLGDNSCQLDLQAVGDERYFTVRNVNVCAEDEWTLTEEE